MGATAAECVEFGKRAEQLGFHSIWMPDRLVYPSPDIFVTLGALAAATSRVMLGSAVLRGVLRPPLLVAKAAVALREISGGRLVLGLGAGSRTEDFDAVEVPLRERGKRLNALCIKHPGFDEDLVLTTDCQTLTHVHMGRLSIGEAERSGCWTIDGVRSLARAVPTWGGTSVFAHVRPVPRPGAAVITPKRGGAAPRWRSARPARAGTEKGSE